MTTTNDIQQVEGPTPSRRTVLAGALGGLVAWAASAIGRAAPVAAVDGDTVLIGSSRGGASTTEIITSTPGLPALKGFSNPGAGAGVGVLGESAGASGVGVFGRGTNATNNANGVQGITASLAGSGVFALNENSGPGSRGYGVFGRSVARDGFGVLGTGDNIGVYGGAKNVGVYADAPNAIALKVVGRATFDRVSGVATIPSGRTTVTVSPKAAVEAASLVLVTPRQNIGSRSLWVTTNPAADTFTIRMSSSRSGATLVAWLLLG
jgi:hypothetical protein